ncbi:unnamed protein product [Rotaria socialis]|uniref:Uncharacterized protein n=1 Tax=Rotaria socialis TaxID=392032 RepID=A0A821ILL6_9BILA|nr:unnamed protein product [Rotaria socialis]
MNAITKKVEHVHIITDDSRQQGTVYDRDLNGNRLNPRASHIREEHYTPRQPNPTEYHVSSQYPYSTTALYQGQNAKTSSHTSITIPINERPTWK